MSSRWLLGKHTSTLTYLFYYLFIFLYSLLCLYEHLDALGTFNMSFSVLREHGTTAACEKNHNQKTQSKYGTRFDDHYMKIKKKLVNENVNLLFTVPAPPIYIALLRHSQVLVFTYNLTIYFTIFAIIVFNLNLSPFPCLLMPVFFICGVNSISWYLPLFSSNTWEMSKVSGRD